MPFLSAIPPNVLETKNRQKLKTFLKDKGSDNNFSSKIYPKIGISQRLRSLAETNDNNI